MFHKLHFEGNVSMWNGQQFAIIYLDGSSKLPNFIYISIMISLVIAGH